MIALVDCNNFYASCERVFQPKLEGKPVIVLSNNDGCAIAISDEAKAVGIKMGAPAFMMEDIIKQHKVNVFSSNYVLYGDLSKRVMDTVGTFASRMEIYSIDETFLDFDGMELHDLTKVGTAIKKTVKQNVGIPVSVGIAPSKTLAKLANRFAKKTKKQIGVHVVKTEDDIKEILKFAEVKDVWGIGAQHAKRLNDIGVKTAYEFTQLPDEWVRKNMSVVGLRTLKELRGTPCIEWEFMPPRKKGICTSRSFGKLINDKKTVEEAVSSFAANCALKLRKDNSCASSIQVFINTNQFRPQDKQYYRSIKMQIPVATNSTSEIIHYALKGLNIIYTEGYNFMKAGVVVTEIVPHQNVQVGIFDDINRTKNSMVMKTLDKINNIYGKDMVRIAAQGYEKKFRMRAQMLSQCYTTRFDQLLTIKI
ncbi:MAG: Y-family DNA polymerase [Bacteroidia bacterium]